MRGQELPPDCGKSVADDEAIQPLLTSSEVAAILKVSVKTLGRLRENGELRGLLVGRQWRYEPKDILKYREQQRDKSAAPAPKPSQRVVRRVAGGYWERWMQLAPGPRDHIRMAIRDEILAIMSSVETQLARDLLWGLAENEWPLKSVPLIARVVSKLLLSEEML